MSDNYESLQELEGTNPTNTSTNNTNQTKKGISKFLKLGTAALLAATAVGYIASHTINHHSDNHTNDTVKTATQNDKTSTMDKLTGFLHKNDTTAPSAINVNQGHYDAYVDPHSPLIKDANQLKEVKEAGNFTVNGNLNASQMGIAIAKAQLQKGDNFLFSSLTSYNEGFLKKYAPDNFGFVIANGINGYQQSHSTLYTLMNTIDQNKQNVHAVASQAGQTQLTEEGKNATVTPQQAAMASMLLESTYQKPVLGIIAQNVRSNPNAMAHSSKENSSPEKIAQQIWDDMPVNQQKVFTYMDYNMGSGNLAKFKNMWKAVVDRHFAPESAKEGMTNLISDHINITYKVNVGGQTQVVENTRLDTILKTAFQSKEAFGYLVGNNPAPSNFAQIAPSVVAFNNGIPQDGTTVKVQDKLADVLSQAATQGKTVTIDQNLDSSSFTTYNDPIDFNQNGLADKIKAMRDNNVKKPAPAHKSFAGMF